MSENENHIYINGKRYDLPPVDPSAQGDTIGENDIAAARRLAMALRGLKSLSDAANDEKSQDLFEFALTGIFVMSRNIAATLDALADECERLREEVARLEAENENLLQGDR
jgi:hypothetical protein